MPAVCRVGDVGEGICHLCDDQQVTVQVVEGSGNTEINGAMAARDGDRCLGSCGHECFIQVTLVSPMTVNGKQVAKVGDALVGNITGHLTQGSPKTEVIE